MQFKLDARLSLLLLKTPTRRGLIGMLSVVRAVLSLSYSCSVLAPELRAGDGLGNLNRTLGDLRKPLGGEELNEQSDKIQNAVPVFNTHESAAKRNQDKRMLPQDEEMPAEPP